VILVDSSVWVDHLCASDQTLVRLLENGQVLVHPFVIGELALGYIRQRSKLLAALQDLPQAGVASDHEVLRFIERHELFGLGIGYVDVHLLAAVRLTPPAVLWTRDKRLLSVASHLGISSGLDQ
jgi:predicted nucleic acid-binding protein